MGPKFGGDKVSGIIACGSVTGVTGVAPISATQLQMRGLAPSTGAAGQSIVKLGGAGTGSYEIHLGDNGTDAYQDGKNCEIRYMVLGIAATDITIHTVSWAAGVITVQANAGAAATDCDFTFVIERLAVG